MVCDPATGTWKTKVIKGNTVLDCYEVNNLVPDTVCACYHFFYGGKCVVTNNHETFCGRSCSSAQPCPAGYGCMTLKLKVGMIKQCVPNDYSCYY